MDILGFLTDYTALRAVWWVLLGLFFWLFAITEGFDMGVAAISASVFNRDEDRRVALNTIGPVWEANQIWLILGAGALFAIWPLVYGVLFTGLYLPITLLLFTLILRPVGFKFRSKIQSGVWRSTWDWALFANGALAALSFGCVLGAMVSGLRFHFDQDLHLYVDPNIAQLFQPLPLCSALLWLMLFITHGGLYLVCKTQDDIQAKMRQFLPLRMWSSVFFYFVMLCVWNLMVPERSVVMPTDGPSNPFSKSVMAVSPSLSTLSWLPTDLFLLSLICFAALTFGMVFFLKKKPRFSFFLSSLRMGVVIATMAIGNFPIIVASSTYIDHSLTIWDASSSYRTLLIILIVGLIFLPVMWAYTIWLYKVFKGPVRASDIGKNTKELY